MNEVFLTLLPKVPFNLRLALWFYLLESFAGLNARTRIEPALDLTVRVAHRVDDYYKRIEVKLHEFRFEVPFVEPRQTYGLWAGYCRENDTLYYVLGKDLLS